MFGRVRQRVLAARMNSISCKAAPPECRPLASMATMESAAQFPVQAAIERQLRAALQPTYLEIVNESHRHNVPLNSETHFKVVVVSDAFRATPSPVARHRLVHAALAEQLQGPVHALSLVCKTPDQWQQMQTEGQAVPASPACVGGDGSLPKRFEK